MKHTIAIIGAGNMGGAFAHGIARAMPKVTLRICDHHPEKTLALQNAQTFTDPEQTIEGAETVLIAVKPQSAQELLDTLLPKLSDRLIISIMAGMSREKLSSLTGSKRIVRAMPNLPAKIGLGMTGWIASKECSTEDRHEAGTLFASVGAQIELKDEKMIDVLTAISGSGPAYFFLLTELLASKAEKEGFSKEQSSLLATQTLIGSAALLQHDAKTPSEWRSAVTSKGGTTEAALASFESNDLERLVSEAIDAAIIRSQELS